MLDIAKTPDYRNLIIPRCLGVSFSDFVRTINAHRTITIVSRKHTEIRREKSDTVDISASEYLCKRGMGELAAEAFNEKRSPTRILNTPNGWQNRGF
jgi:hypothetical protein